MLMIAARLLAVPARFRRLGCLILLAWAVVGGTPVLAVEPAAAADCDVAQNDTSTASSGTLGNMKRCIGGRAFSSRGWLLPQCLTQPPVMRGIYPRSNYCKNGNNQGVEAIAQARAIAYFNGGHTPGVRGDIQWEVYSGGRVDITLETSEFVEVYEVKTAKNAVASNPWAQVSRYVNVFNTPPETVPPSRRGRVQPNGAAAWIDGFGVKTATKCGQNSYASNLYVSWLITYGVIMVYDLGAHCLDDDDDWPTVPVKYATVEDEEEVDPAPRSVPVPQVPAGTVTMIADDVVKNPPLDPKIPPLPPLVKAPPPPAQTSRTYADPHLVTFDGVGYDFHAVGEFHLAESPALGLDVQARMAAAGDSVSQIDRIAFFLQGHRVEIASSPQKLWIDGEAVEMQPDEVRDFGFGAYLIRDGDAYVANWPSTDEVRPVLRARGYQVDLTVPPGAELRGLLGDNDGTRDNDFRTRSGTQLPNPPSSTTLYGSFADSWRIDDDESQFTYAADESTASFTDLSFPRQIVTVHGLSDEVLAEGTRVCSAAGVLDGRQFDDCVVDWAQTRNPAFVEAAAALTEPVVDASARRLDANGEIAEDFEASIAANFASPRYGTGAGSGSVRRPVRARRPLRVSGLRTPDQSRSHADDEPDHVRHMVAAGREPDPGRSRRQDRLAGQPRGDADAVELGRDGDRDAVSGLSRDDSAAGARRRAGDRRQRRATARHGPGVRGRRSALPHPVTGPGRVVCVVAAGDGRRRNPCGRRRAAGDHGVHGRLPLHARATGHDHDRVRVRGRGHLHALDPA